MTGINTHVCIGMARSGTTWLFEALKGSDKIFLPPAKEVRYWFGSPTKLEKIRHYDDLSKDGNLTTFNETWLKSWINTDSDAPNIGDYRKLMLVRGTDSLDISPSYASMPPQSIQRLFDSISDGSKVFAVFRNPVERAASEFKLHAYLHGGFRGSADDSTVAEFLNEPWRVNSRSYTRIYNQWSVVFGDRFKVFYYEDMKDDPREFLKSILNFVGVSGVGSEVFESEALKKYVATDRNQGKKSIYPDLTTKQYGIISSILNTETRAFREIDARACDMWDEKNRDRFPSAVSISGSHDSASSDFKKMLRLTENFGDNCEFGFVQRNEGYEPSSLFRWSITPIDALVKYMENPTPLFLKDNLRCVESDLVFDSDSGFYFYSDLISAADGQRRFVSSDRFEEIYKAEKEKIEHLAFKFWHFTHSRAGVYVVKANAGINDKSILALLEQVKRRHSKSLVLHVANGPEVDLVDIAPGLFRGYIPNFAAYSSANKVDFASWREVLSRLSEKPEVKDLIRHMFV